MYKVVKRVLDVLFSLIALIVLSPLFLVVAIAIKLDSPGPVFFMQKRIAKKQKNGKTRYLYLIKFRTMRIDAPKNTPTHLLENPEQYISRVGAVLRKFSIDECANIINVILPGQLSIIGPRPALWNQYDLIAERDKYGANDVKPGITGWAQIHGRDELSIELKAWYDGEYVKHFGFLMDCKCFLGSIKAVLRKDGVVEGKAAQPNPELDEVTVVEEVLVRK